MEISTAALPATKLVSDQAGGGASLWGADGFTFKDLFDIINPFQQLPVVGTLYRAITGDAMSIGSSLLGGGLLGGPVGLASAGLNAAVEIGTGQDIGGNLLSLLGSGGGETQTASLGGATATKLQSDSQGWFSLFSSLMPDPALSYDISSRRKASAAYAGAQKLTS